MVKQKTEIRKQVLAARRGLGREEVIRSSRIILEKAEKYLDLAQMDLYLYASCQNEVDTMQLIKDCLSRKQKIALPRVCEDGIHMKFYYNCKFCVITVAIFLIRRDIKEFRNQDCIVSRQQRTGRKSYLFRELHLIKKETGSVMERVFMTDI